MERVPCDYDWVKSLQNECKKYDVTFCFIETGTVFIKDGKRYNIPNKRIQSEMAYKSGISYSGKKIKFNLKSRYGYKIPESEMYVPYFREVCGTCGSRPICNGCGNCGRCSQVTK